MTEQIHRGLHLTTPLTRGDDVRALQYAINQVDDDKGGFWQVGRDGVYGDHTAHSAFLSAWALGISEDEDAMKDLKNRGHCNQDIQNWLRHPNERNDVQKDRAERIKDEVARKIASHHAGADAAVRWAVGEDGVHEAGDTNWGHPIQDWLERCGYNEPEPWCGAFAREAVVGHGLAKIPNDNALGYSGNIDSQARAGANGLHAVGRESGQKGDIGTLNFDGGASDHVVVLRGGYSDGYYPTVEGNTSADANGSQNNGGSVALKSRAASLFVTIARPDY